eukprot:69860-Pleurochrysis_carterae.AAC.3
MQCQTFTRNDSISSATRLHYSMHGGYKHVRCYPHVLAQASCKAAVLTWHSLVHCVCLLSRLAAAPAVASSAPSSVWLRLGWWRWR